MTEPSITPGIAVAHGYGPVPPRGSAEIGSSRPDSSSGALARLIVPGRQRLGILATLALGLVGGLIARFPATGSIWQLNVIGFVLAVVAAVLLIGVPESVAGKSRGQVR